MARARNRNNQRGDYGRKPVGPIGKKPTPRTGGGMKKPPIRGPKPTDTGGRVVTPKKRPPIRGPKPTDTGGRVVTPKKKPPTPRISDTGTGLRLRRRPVRNSDDGLTPVRRRRMLRSRRAPMRRGR